MRTFYGTGGIKYTLYKSFSQDVFQIKFLSDKQPFGNTKHPLNYLNDDENKISKDSHNTFAATMLHEKSGA